jgi:hypothetical protein
MSAAALEARPMARGRAAAMARLAAATREAIRREPAYAAACVLLAVSMAPVALAHAIDPRVMGAGVLAEPIWLKPLKFQAALLLYLGTLAAFALARPAVPRRPRAYAAFTWVVVAAVAFEIVAIAGAAALGTISHFNTATPTAEAIYTAMGVGAVTLTTASLVTGIMIARGGQGGPALRLGLVLGLVLTFAATLVVAGTMSSLPGRLVGEATVGARLPILGWSREVGDLRVPHFLATHAMHAVPALALLAAWRLPAPWARRATWAAAAAFAALIAATFAQALAGRPFLPL